MRRGDLVTVVLPGAYGKPRPALVIQSDFFLDQHPSVTVLALTSDLAPTPLFRIQVEPDATNGLLKPSQVMVDKAYTVPREKIGSTIGRLDGGSLKAVDLRPDGLLGAHHPAPPRRAAMSKSKKFDEVLKNEESVVAPVLRIVSCDR